MYACPNCGAHVTADNSTCPQCGVPLAFQPQEQTQVIPEQAAPTQPMPTPGPPPPTQPMPAPAPPPPPTQPMPAPAPPQAYDPSQAYAPDQGYGQPKKSKAPLIIGIVVAVVVVLGIGIGAFVLLSDSGDTPSTPPPSVVTPPADNPPADNPPADNPPAGSSSAIVIDGEVTGTVGQLYETIWFTFTVESMSVSSSYNDMTAASGKTFVISHISLKNIFGTPQPFSAYDWFIEGPGNQQFEPLEPVSGNAQMMPTSFELDDQESASYDVVFEIPSDLTDAYIVYVEVNGAGQSFSTFKLPIK